MASMLVQEIKRRFPDKPLLDTFEIVYPQYWARGAAPSSKDLFTKVKQLENYYCREQHLPDGTVIAPLLSTTALKGEIGAFKQLMQVASGPFMKRHAAACRAAEQAKQPAPAAAVSQFWKEQGSKPAYITAIPTYIKLAQIALVMVGGSVQDERAFSNLTFIKNDLRSCLSEEHLNACMLLFATKNEFSLAGFPYREAYDAWFGVCRRRGVTLDMGADDGADEI